MPPEVINKFRKFAGYNINIQKSVAFLYTNNEIFEREIKKTIPFIVPSKTIKYLGINLTKTMKDLYTENYKTFFFKDSYASEFLKCALFYFYLKTQFYFILTFWPCHMACGISVP